MENKQQTDSRQANKLKSTDGTFKRVYFWKVEPYQQTANMQTNCCSL